MPSGFEHSVRVQLRWRDMDMLGHLNQSVYHELLEEGRVALVAELVRRLGRGRVGPGQPLQAVPDRSRARRAVLKQEADDAASRGGRPATC